jgi:RNA polymerase sigma-70 factor (ECF subfamily)
MSADDMRATSSKAAWATPEPAVRTTSADRLVASAVGGSDVAWRELHRQLRPVAAAFLRKMGVPEVDLDDALQNVFVQMVRYLPGFRGEAAIKTWLYRVCLSEAKELGRRAKLRATLHKLLWNERAAVAAVTQELSEVVARRRVEAALAGLKEHERSVFVLYEMEGLSGEQIAEIVGCPVATVWRRLHYARAAFKDGLEAGGGNGREAGP